MQRYQLAVNEAKVRLNLAVCPGAWLNAGENGHQHGKHSGLQQRAQASESGNETRH